MNGAAAGEPLETPGPPRGGSWFTMREAEAILGLNEQTIRKRIREGAIDGIKVQGPHGLTWKIRLPGVEEADPGETPGPSRAEPEATPETPRGEHGALMVDGRERIFRDLWERTAELERKIGVYEGQLVETRAALSATQPALAEGQEARERAKRLEQEVGAVTEKEAQARTLQSRAEGRVRILTALSAVLALLCAVMGGMLLSRATGRSDVPGPARPAAARLQAPPPSPETLHRATPRPATKAPPSGGSGRAAPAGQSARSPVGKP